MSESRDVSEVLVALCTRGFYAGERFAAAYAAIDGGPGWVVVNHADDEVVSETRRDYGL